MSMECVESLFLVLEYVYFFLLITIFVSRKMLAVNGVRCLLNDDNLSSTNRKNFDANELQGKIFRYDFK